MSHSVNRLESKLSVHVARWEAQLDDMHAVQAATKRIYRAARKLSVRAGRDEEDYSR